MRILQMKRTFSLVLLILALMAAASCRQHSQKATPKPQKETPQPITTEQITGFLDIDAGSPPESGSSPHLPGWGFINGYNGWVFINGELLGKMPFHQQRMLVPERYEVRVVLARETQNGSVVFWTVSWPNVRIEKGKTLSIKTKETADRWVLQSDKINGLEYYEPPREPSPLSARDVTFFNEDTERRLAEAQAELEKRWQIFLNTDAWKSIEAALRSPPSRPRVWLDLPTDLGGARQVDSEQLHLLSKVIKPDFGGWPAIVTEHPGLPEDTRLRLNQLSAFTGQREQYVQNVFNEMTSRLESTKEDRR